MTPNTFTINYSDNGKPRSKRFPSLRLAMTFGRNLIEEGIDNSPTMTFPNGKTTVRVRPREQ